MLDFDQTLQFSNEQTPVRRYKPFDSDLPFWVLRISLACHFPKCACSKILAAHGSNRVDFKTPNQFRDICINCGERILNARELVSVDSAFPEPSSVQSPKTPIEILPQKGGIRFLNNVVMRGS
jgi:hypothetical protein